MLIELDLYRTSDMLDLGLLGSLNDSKIIGFLDRDGDRTNGGESEATCIFPKHIDSSS